MPLFYPLEVADAWQSFASSNVSLLPPLLVPLGPQTGRPSLGCSHDNLSQVTWPLCRALPANQIFQVKEVSSPDQSMACLSSPAQNDHHGAIDIDILPSVLSKRTSPSTFSCDNPWPTLWMTMLGCSLENPRILDIDVGMGMMLSKCREKSKSANNLKPLIRSTVPDSITQQICLCPNQNFLGQMETRIMIPHKQHNLTNLLVPKPELFRANGDQNHDPHKKNII